MLSKVFVETISVQYSQDTLFVCIQGFFIGPLDLNQ